jgi:hypothetical protein
MTFRVSPTRRVPPNFSVSGSAWRAWAGPGGLPNITEARRQVSLMCWLCCQLWPG